jgi:hypothetical protein
MPRHTQEGQFQDWESLVKEVQKTPELAGAAPFVKALAKVHLEAVCYRALRDELYAASQRATRRLNESCGAGKEAAIALRSFVKSKLGYRNEELVRFGIAPQRRRVRRGKTQVM